MNIVTYIPTSEEQRTIAVWDSDDNLYNDSDGASCSTEVISTEIEESEESKL